VIATRNGFEVLRFPVRQSSNSFSFTYVELLAVPTASLINNRNTEHFKSITSSNHSSAIADHVTSTGHNMKWDHFEILARGRSEAHCKIKETLLIRDLQPSLNENVSGENLTFYSLHAFPFICKFFYYLLSFVSIISYLLYTQISVVI